MSGVKKVSFKNILPSPKRSYPRDLVTYLHWVDDFIIRRRVSPEKMIYLWIEMRETALGMEIQNGVKETKEIFEGAYRYHQKKKIYTNLTRKFIIQ